MYSLNCVSHGGRIKTSPEGDVVIDVPLRNEKDAEKFRATCDRYSFKSRVRIVRALPQRFGPKAKTASVAPLRAAAAEDSLRGVRRNTAPADYQRDQFARKPRNPRRSGVRQGIVASSAHPGRVRVVPERTVDAEGSRESDEEDDEYDVSDQEEVCAELEKTTTTTTTVFKESLHRPVSATSLTTVDEKKKSDLADAFETIRRVHEKQTTRERIIQRVYALKDRLDEGKAASRVKEKSVAVKQPNRDPWKTAVSVERNVGRFRRFETLDRIEHWRRSVSKEKNSAPEKKIEKETKPSGRKRKSVKEFDEENFKKRPSDQKDQLSNSETQDVSTPVLSLPSIEAADLVQKSSARASSQAKSRKNKEKQKRVAKKDEGENEDEDEIAESDLTNKNISVKNNSTGNFDEDNENQIIPIDLRQEDNKTFSENDQEQNKVKSPRPTESKPQDQIHLVKKPDQFLNNTDSEINIDEKAISGQVRPYTKTPIENFPANLSSEEDEEDSSIPNLESAKPRPNSSVDEAARLEATLRRIRASGNQGDKSELISVLKRLAALKKEVQADRAELLSNRVAEVQKDPDATLRQLEEEEEERGKEEVGRTTFCVEAVTPPSSREGLIEDLQNEKETDDQKMSESSDGYSDSFAEDSEDESPIEPLQARAAPLKSISRCASTPMEEPQLGRGANASLSRSNAESPTSLHLDAPSPNVVILPSVAPTGQSNSSSRASSALSRRSQEKSDKFGSQDLASVVDAHLESAKGIAREKVKSRPTSGRPTSSRPPSSRPISGLSRVSANQRPGTASRPETDDHIATQQKENNCDPGHSVNVDLKLDSQVDHVGVEIESGEDKNNLEDKLDASPQNPAGINEVEASSQNTTQPSPEGDESPIETSGKGSSVSSEMKETVGEDRDILEAKIEDETSPAIDVDQNIEVAVVVEDRDSLEEMDAAALQSRVSSARALSARSRRRAASANSNDRPATGRSIVRANSRAEPTNVSTVAQTWEVMTSRARRESNVVGHRPKTPSRSHSLASSASDLHLSNSFDDKRQLIPATETVSIYDDKEESKQVTGCCSGSICCGGGGSVAARRFRLVQIALVLLILVVVLLLVVIFLLFCIHLNHEKTESAAHDEIVAMLKKLETDVAMVKGIGGTTSSATVETSVAKTEKMIATTLGIEETKASTGYVIAETKATTLAETTSEMLETKTTTATSPSTVSRSTVSAESSTKEPTTIASMSTLAESSTKEQTTIVPVSTTFEESTTNTELVSTKGEARTTFGSTKLAEPLTTETATVSSASSSSVALATTQPATSISTTSTEATESATSSVATEATPSATTAPATTTPPPTIASRCSDEAPDTTAFANLHDGAKKLDEAIRNSDNLTVVKTKANQFKDDVLNFFVLRGVNNNDSCIPYYVHNFMTFVRAELTSLNDACAEKRCTVEPTESVVTTTEATIGEDRELILQWMIGNLTENLQQFDTKISANFDGVFTNLTTEREENGLRTELVNSLLKNLTSFRFDSESKFAAVLRNTDAVEANLTRRAEESVALFQRQLVEILEHIVNHSLEIEKMRDNATGQITDLKEEVLNGQLAALNNLTISIKTNLDSLSAQNGTIYDIFNAVQNQMRSMLDSIEQQIAQQNSSLLEPISSKADAILANQKSQNDSISQFLSMAAINRQLLLEIANQNCSAVLIQSASNLLGIESIYSNLTQMSSLLDGKVVATFPDIVKTEFVRVDVVGCTPVYIEQREIEQAGALCGNTSTALTSLTAALGIDNSTSCVDQNTINQFKSDVNELKTLVASFTNRLHLECNCSSASDDSSVIKTVSSLSTEFVVAFPYKLQSKPATILVTPVDIAGVKVTYRKDGADVNDLKVVAAESVKDWSMTTDLNLLASPVQQNVEKAVTVTSDVNSAVVVLMGEPVGDAYLALPTAAWGNRYVIPSYAPSTSLPAALVIMAIRPDTVLTVTLRAAIGSCNVAYDSVSLAVNFIFHLICPGDITGAEVISNQPIGVLTAVSCSDIPIGDANRQCQQLLAQVPPVSGWGTRYITSGMMGDILRVLGSEATEIKLNYNLSSSNATLGAKGDFHDFEIAAGELVSVICTKPCLLTQISKLRLDGIKYYRPAMFIVPSMNQYSQDKIIFPTPDIGTTDGEYYLQIVTETENIANLTLDGSKLNMEVGWATAPGMSEYSHLLKRISATAHKLETDKAGVTFSAFVHGYNTNPFAVMKSYAFPASLNVIP